MDKEMQGLAESKTFTVLGKLPEGETAFGSRWVLSYKADKEGLITKTKARLVVKGFMQSAKRGCGLPSNVRTHARSGISQDCDGCC
ncbi:unnamed protein product [Laminaria digitata]